jgi:hypothetical protein
MPNHCNCHVTVIGHKEDLDEFEEHQLSFQHFVPRPVEAEADWYTWNVQHWGTKWEAWDYELKERDENFLVVDFTTAWAPPIAFFEALLQRYPRCWLKCIFNEESGMAGVWVGSVKAGVVKSKNLVWDEPEPALTTDGEIYIPDEEEDTNYETKSSD